MPYLEHRYHLCAPLAVIASLAAIPARRMIAMRQTLTLHAKGLPRFLIQQYSWQDSRSI